jgi:IS66 C-terminal element
VLPEKRYVGEPNHRIKAAQPCPQCFANRAGSASDQDAMHGSDGGAERWATVCSLIASAKLNDVEPFTYLRDVLQRMTEGHPMRRLDELLPWNWPKIPVKH